MGCFWGKNRVRRDVEQGQSTVTDNYNVNQTTSDNAAFRPTSASQVHPNVTDTDQSNADFKPHERNLSKQRESDTEVEKLEAEVQLKTEIEDSESKMKQIEHKHQTTLEEDSKNHSHTMEEKDEQLSRQTTEIQELTEAKESLPTCHSHTMEEKDEQLSRQTTEIQEPTEAKESLLTRLRLTLEEKDEQLSRQTTEIHELTEAKESLLTRHHHTVEEKDKQLSRQKTEIQELTEAKESLLTRLSAMASAKLTDGNANIADLSDENRPTKLAEKYSELYDNEWTNAYEVLSNSGKTEENTCLILSKALCTTYTVCQKKANTDWETMTEGMKTFLGGQDVSAELVKPLKDRRKKMYQGHKKSLKEDLKPHIKEILSMKWTCTDPNIKHFIGKCIELCWLMVIQDPPVFMDVGFQQSGEKYESDVMKPYTRSGKYIDYIVWPPIYLQKDGSVLCKGVCQCKEDNTITETVHNQQEEAESEDSQTVSITTDPEKEHSDKTTEERNAGSQPPFQVQTGENIENTKLNANSVQTEEMQNAITPEDETEKEPNDKATEARNPGTQPPPTVQTDGNIENTNTNANSVHPEDEKEKEHNDKTTEERNPGIYTPPPVKTGETIENTTITASSVQKENKQITITPDDEKEHNDKAIEERNPGSQPTPPVQTEITNINANNVQDENKQKKDCNPNSQKTGDTSASSIPKQPTERTTITNTTTNNFHTNKELPGTSEIKTSESNQTAETLSSHDKEKQKTTRMDKQRNRGAHDMSNSVNVKSAEHDHQNSQTTNIQTMSCNVNTDRDSPTVEENKNAQNRIEKIPDSETPITMKSQVAPTKSPKTSTKNDGHDTSKKTVGAKRDESKQTSSQKKQTSKNLKEDKQKPKLNIIVAKF